MYLWDFYETTLMRSTKNSEHSSRIEIVHIRKEITIISWNCFALKKSWEWKGTIIFGLHCTIQFKDFIKSWRNACSFTSHLCSIFAEVTDYGSY